MLPEPLHPVLVHFPIVLSSLLPPLAIYGLIASHKSSRLRPWLAVVIVAALALLSGLLTQQAGEREEDRVEAWVPGQALEDHEENAERFVWSLGAVLGCSLLGLTSRRVGRVARVLTIAALVPTAGLLFSVGESGGDLVYKHGAAAAYSGSPQAAIQRGIENDD